MNKVILYPIVFFLLMMLTAFSARAAEIQVAVDRNVVNLNESFRITFTANETPDGNPDFAPLEENFQIINQQRSSNASWVNGKSSRTEQWIINVLPKQAGDFLIPPIAFGADISRPLKLTVTDNPQPQQSSAELFLEVDATPEKPYVQSQVLYTLKLYRRVQITQASLNEPEVKDALVEKLGEDSTYTTQVNGVDYWVTERKYAIFPQQSGLVTIAPLTLNAEVLSSQQPRFNGFFNHQSTETRRISSKAITLNVQAVPDTFTGSAWLSADALTLKESWSDSRLQTKVGEPLTRTITLTAQGATVGQLPELDGQFAIDGIKTYPDQPLLKEDKLSSGLTAIREEKIAYIPSKPGEYTLPALQIEWFNTKSGKTETVHLPAVTIKAIVVAGDNRQVPAPSQAIPPETKAEAPQDRLVAPETDSLLWPGLAVFFALGWLSTLFWIYRRRPINAKPIDEAKVKAPADISLKSLRTHCLQNDPQAANKVLLQWGKREFGVDSLSALAAVSGQPLADEILNLSRHIYASEHRDWNGQNLWRAFTERAAADAEKGFAESEPLEPLYKL